MFMVVRISVLIKGYKGEHRTGTNNQSCVHFAMFDLVLEICTKSCTTLFWDLLI